MKRSADYRLINRLAEVNVCVSSDFYYLVDEDNLWTFEPYKSGYRIHANMKTKKGKQAIESAKQAMNWMFKNAKARKIFASVPIENRASRMLVRHCMDFVGKDAEYHYYEVENV